MECLHDDAVMQTHRADDTDVNNNICPTTTSEMEQSSVGKSHYSNESDDIRNNMLRNASLPTTTSGPTVATLVERFNSYAEVSSERLSGKECDIYDSPSTNIDLAQDNGKVDTCNTQRHEIPDTIIENNLVDIENSQPSPNDLVSAIKGTASEAHAASGNNTGSATDSAKAIDKPEPGSSYLDLIATNDQDKHNNDDGPATDNHDDGPTTDNQDYGPATDSADDDVIKDDNLDRDDGPVSQNAPSDTAEHDYTNNPNKHINDDVPATDNHDDGPTTDNHDHGPATDGADDDVIKDDNIGRDDGPVFQNAPSETAEHNSTNEATFDNDVTQEFAPNSGIATIYDNDHIKDATYNKPPNMIMLMPLYESTSLVLSKRCMTEKRESRLMTCHS